MLGQIPGSAPASWKQDSSSMKTILRVKLQQVSLVIYLLVIFKGLAMHEVESSNLCQGGILFRFPVQPTQPS